MGSAENIRVMLAEVILDISEHHTFTGAPRHRIDDQRWFTRYYLRNNEIVTLDTDGIMFHTLHDIESERLIVMKDRIGTIWSNYSNTSPCVLHGNGNGIETFHDVSRRLVVAGWPPNAKSDTTSSNL